MHGSTSEGGTIWTRFWLRPTDPTTLGFLRIVTGILVLYTHLVYSFDLQEFFGKYGWFDLQAVNRQRYEQPVLALQWTWDDPQHDNEADPVLAPRLPVLEDRRTAVQDFLMSLPTNADDRRASLEYLYTISLAPIVANELYLKEALNFLPNAAQLEPKSERKFLDALEGKEVPAEEMPISVPSFFRAFQPADQLRIYQEAKRLFVVFPRTTVEFTYLIDWLAPMAPAERRSVVRYCIQLPDDYSQRNEVVSYLFRWNSDPRYLAGSGWPVFSVWFHLTNPTAMAAFHAVLLIVIVLFTLGFASRTTSVLTWFGTVMYLHRNQQALFGQDSMQNILLFYLMFGPSGAALSLDRLFARRRAARAIESAGGKSVPWAEAILAGPAPSRMANVVVRLLQIHFCMIYLSSGLSKLKGLYWWNGEAGWMTLVNAEFTPIQYAFYEKTLRWITNSRAAIGVVCASITYYTLLLEITFPFMVWTRLRPLYVTMSAMLHTGIAVIMGLTVFSLFMLALVAAFFSSETIARRFAWRGADLPTMTVRSRGPAFHRARIMLRMLDVRNQIRFEEARSDDGFEVTLADGSIVKDAIGVKATVRTLALVKRFFFLKSLPGL